MTHFKRPSAVAALLVAGFVSFLFGSNWSHADDPARTVAQQATDAKAAIAAKLAQCATLRDRSANAALKAAEAEAALKAAEAMLRQNGANSGQANQLKAQARALVTETRNAFNQLLADLGAANVAAVEAQVAPAQAALLRAQADLVINPTDPAFQAVQTAAAQALAKARQDVCDVQAAAQALAQAEAAATVLNTEFSNGVVSAAQASARAQAARAANAAAQAAAAAAAQALRQAEAQLEALQNATAGVRQSANLEQRLRRVEAGVAPATPSGTQSSADLQGLEEVAQGRVLTPDQKRLYRLAMKGQLSPVEVSGLKDNILFYSRIE